MTTLSFPAESSSYQASLARTLRAPRSIPLLVRVVKRTTDVAVSASGLVLASWLFLLIAVAIVVDSPGPIFYRQRRVARLKGRDEHGRCTFDEFDMLKFRTMRPDAERLSGAVLAEENDPRVTRLGRFLRKSRLDELPQLWSVLRGDMSLVGPRPERPELLENLALAIPFFEERMHDAKPGITGLAQVSLGYAGRALPGTPIAGQEADLVNPLHIPEASGSLADDMRMKLLFDLAYVTALERFSTFLRMDALVILKTPWVMLRGIGR